MFLSTLLRNRLAAIILSSVVVLSVASASVSAGEKAAALPVETSFGAGTPGDNGGPYALTVKNTSKESLAVSATIAFSVQSHNRDKSKTVGPEEIAAGGKWVINDLAVGDTVTLTAEGYAPLVLTTPPGK